MRHIDRFIGILFFLMTVVPLHAGSGMEWGIALDGLSLDGVVARDWEIGLDARLRLDDYIEIHIPFAMGFSQGKSFLGESGLAFHVHPWRSGPFFNIPFIHIGFLSQSGTPVRLLWLDEVSFGWTFPIGGSGWFIEPRCTIRDPSHSYQQEYTVITEALPAYRSVHIGLRIGLYLDTGGPSQVVPTDYSIMQIAPVAE